MFRRIFLAARTRARVLCCIALALIVATTDTTALAGTTAYFTTSTTTPLGSMSTVRLNVSTSSSASSIFNVPANMVPGDFQIKTIDLVNNGTVGNAQQDFTYGLTSTSTGTGNMCSLLDSSNPPTCSSPAAPSALAGTAAALLLLRCTTVDPAIPLACNTTNVYVTQVYPLAGAGSPQEITTTGGLTRAAVSGVATAAGSYAIGIGGASFTGGSLLVSGPFGFGGPDGVAGADGQSLGLAASRTDHLASVVYLPTQAGDALANQTSILTFTWTAAQRVGGKR